MQFAYYPGCSLSATGRAYQESTAATAGKLDIELTELEGWNCCGATTYMSVRELLSYAISARNLSLAMQRGQDIVAPCSACFTILRKTDHYLHTVPDLRKKVKTALEAAGLSYEPGSVKVRHLLEVTCANGGLDRIRDQVTRPLKGLKVAPYYGCQIVRPAVPWDNAENPMMLDRLLDALGADVQKFPAKTRCCGASLMASNEAAALRLCKNLLLCAQQNGAEIIVTTCPLCQMNLDAFQKKINAIYGTSFSIPVLYFTQLLGVAMGVGTSDLGLGREIVAAAPYLERFTDMPKQLTSGQEN
ncbi:MAG TPA: CoB--CoM heterodisulfide reductase iron-sulfur subunit B family protein [Polyangia bacterium]